MNEYKYKVAILNSLDGKEQVIAEGLDEDIAIILMKALFDEYYLEEDLQIAIQRNATSGEEQQRCIR